MSDISPRPWDIDFDTILSKYGEKIIEVRDWVEKDLEYAVECVNQHETLVARAEELEEDKKYQSTMLTNMTRDWYNSANRNTELRIDNTELRSKNKQLRDALLQAMKFICKEGCIGYGTVACTESCKCYALIELTKEDTND